LKKIHYHTDCEFFAGCEKMLIYFFKSDLLNEKFKLSFSYAYSKNYAEVLQNYLPREMEIYPLNNLYIQDRFLRKIGFITSYSQIFRIIRFLFRPLNLIMQIYLLYILFSKIKPDILHINNGGYPGALSSRAAVIAGKILGINLIVMVVNNTAIGYSKISRFFDFPVDLFVRNNTNLFITGSIASSNRLRNVLGLNQNKVFVINNGLDVKDFHENEFDSVVKGIKLEYPDAIIFGVIALLEERKGHLVLLKAVNQLRNKHSLNKNNFQILIEGWGPLFYKLTSYVNENNLNDYVKFIGISENINLFTKSIDSLILPSIRDEDFPNVILEAMAYGKPVISTRIAGIPEQVDHNVNGFLVMPGNVEELSNILSRVIRSPRLLTNMSEHSMNRYLAKYTSELAVKKYINLYSGLS
jgi:glycosyltransferase involved in cell wall biosynthesis